jgi:hypothetical protein
MNDKELARILGRCLDDIAAGAMPSACLARYPQHAAELAPLLLAANEVAALGGYQLSDGARARAIARLRQAEAARRERPAGLTGWFRPASLAFPRAAIGLVIALLCVALTAGIVAASQPGDAAYGARVAAERFPALLARTAAARARAELGIAARRMADLDRTMASQEQELDSRTLDALLSSTDAAASLAASLPEAEHAAAAAQLNAQAEQLARWGRTSRRPQQGVALAAAAERTHHAALAAGEGLPEPQPVAPQTGPTEAPRAGVPSVTSTHAPSHIARPTATSTPAPGTPTAVAPTPRAERRAGSPTVQAGEGNAASQGTRGPERTPAPARQGSPATPALQPTSPGPGPQPTAQGSGPEATSPGPQPTPPGPGPQPTGTGPGPQPTSPGPGSETTPAGPGPDPTSPGPDGPPANTPGPRKRP